MLYSKLLGDIGYTIPVPSSITRGRSMIYPMELSTITHLLMRIGEVSNIPGYENVLKMIDKYQWNKKYKKIKNIFECINDQSSIEYDIPFPPTSDYTFTFADIFCNVGGMTLAAKYCGGIPVFAADSDKKVRWKKMYYMNHGLIPFEHPTWLHPPFPEVDFLFASVDIDDIPLNRGKKATVDNIGDTNWFTVIEMVNKLQPKAVIIECRKSQAGELLNKSVAVAHRTLKEGTGYCMVSPIILDALNYGVPQGRRRLWFAAFQNPISAILFEWPTPIPRVWKLKDVLEDKVDPKHYLSRTHQLYLERNKKYNLENDIRFSHRVLDPEKESKSIVFGGQGWDSNIIVQPEHMPTILPNGEVPNDYGWRRLTPIELARLQGFPDNYLVPDGWRPSWELIGRATNVKVAEAVIKCALNAINPDNVIEGTKTILSDSLNLK